MTNATGGLFLGAFAYPLANSDTNESVIGANGIGNGSNTMTLGSGATTTVYHGQAGGASLINGNETAYGTVTVEGVATPSGTPTGAPSGSGGTVAAGSNYMKIVCIDAAANHSLSGTESALVTTSGATSSIKWAWTQDLGCQSYQVWVGSTSGGEANYFTSTTNSYTQTLPISSGTSGTIPASSTSGGALAVNALQTTVSCSTSGTAVFSETLQGVSDKKVLIHLAACNGTASYTYPVAFTNTPSVYGSNNVAASIATSVSTSAVTVTGAPSTGSLMIEDY
jgi:hypothetical protein